jgi:hypothetical protein
LKSPTGVTAAPKAHQSSEFEKSALQSKKKAVTIMKDIFTSPHSGGI